MNNFTSTVFIFRTHAFKNFVTTLGLVLTLLISSNSYGQTTVTASGMTNTCPAAPTTTWATPPTGLTFSNITKGAGVSCSTLTTGISGTGFNGTLAANITASAWYSFTITSDASTAFTLNNLNIISQVSSATGSPNVSVQYSTNGGTTKTVVGSYTPTTTSTTYTITPGSAISVPASTSLIIYIIPNNLTVSTTTCRITNSSTVSVTAAAAGPTVNGTIAANEYGVHTNGSNQQTNAITWYNTANATNLYFGIGATSNNSSEAAVVYLDVNPIVPVNGGTNTNGTNVGYAYDRSTVNPAFRADYVLYFKSGYYELRAADGSGGWSASPVTTGLTYAQSGAGATQTQEISIPWSLLGGSQPASYNFSVYKVYDVSASNNGIYGQLPANNPGGAQNQTAYTLSNNRYQTVSATTTTLPFSRISYCQPIAVTTNDFGSASFYDFTVNPGSGFQVARSATAGGAWTISGNLVVGSGNLYFGSGGSTFGTTTVGNINVVGGTLNMDQTSVPMNVSGTVAIASGATLALSGAVGGDLNVGGNWSNLGTFTPSTRLVQFNGTVAQTLTGATTFDYIKMNNSAGLTLNNAVTVTTNLDLTLGKINLGANNLTLAAAAGATNASATGYVVTNSTGAFIKNSVGNTATAFPVGLAASYTPLSVTNTGTTNNLSLVVTAPPANVVSDATKIVNLEWNLNAGGSGAVANVTFNWNTPSNVGASYVATGTGELGNYTAGPNYAITAIGAMAGTTKTVSGIALSSGSNKLVLGNTSAVYATPPSNDNCTGALALTLDAAAITGITANATLSLAASCAGTANDDVWYSFTTGAAGTYTVTVVGSASFDAVVDVRSGACNGTNIFCADVTASGGTETVTATGLAASTTYYIRVYDFGSGVPATTSFTIAVASPPATLSTNGTTILTFSTTQGPLTQSASQTFNLSGSNLTGAPGTITVTAPNTNFEVSNNNSSWGAITTIAYSSATLASTPVYVRFTPQSSGAKTGNLTFSGGGTSGNPTIALTGTGVLPAPVANAATTISATSFDANWSAVTGASSGYLLDVSTSATFGTSSLATLNEGAETGGLTGAYQSGTFTLGSGSWTVVNALKASGTNINTGTGGFQLQGGTSASATSPSLNNVSTLTFYAKRGATATNLIVQKIVSGVTTPLQTIALTTTFTQYTISVNDSSTAVQIVFLNGAAVSYVDDVVIGYTNVTPSFVTGYNAKPIAGQATVTAPVTGLTADTTYYYRLRATDGTPSAYSNVITVNPASRGGSVTADQTICSGTAPATLTLAGNNGTVVKWQSATNTAFTGAVDIANTTSTLTDVAIGNLTTTTYFRAVVQSFTNPTANSTYATITVAQSPTFANLQSPPSGVVCQTSTFDVFGQVYQAGVTESAGAGAGITAQFGYNGSNTDPATWTNWTNATFNSQVGNNDEYKYTFTPPAAGTYYYTFRYRQGTCTYVYGGYSGSGGGFWNGTSNLNGVLTVNSSAVHTISLSSGTGTNTQAFCENTAIPTAITYTVGGGATGAGVTGLPSGMSGSYNAGTFAITGTPTASGTYNYTVTTTGNGCATAVTATGTVTISSALDFANLQFPGSGTICQGATLIAYGQVYEPGVTQGAGQGSGITVQFGYDATNTNPSTWTTWTAASYSLDSVNNDEYLYTFTPLSSGTFYYTFRYKQGSCDWQYGGYSSGGGGFWNGTTNVNGVLTVNQNTAGAASSTPALCINTALTNITHATTGATGIGAATGLPAGVTAAWASNVITISGTPSASGTFGYSIPVTGGCGSVNATGTITVTPLNTIAAGTSQTVCINTAITNITLTTTGATGATFAGLPAGVTGSWAADVVTISGTPTVSGTFNYTVTTTGGCLPATTGGTITVVINTWIGTTTSWTTPGNWSCGVPISTANVRISSAAAYPEISSDVTINSILLDSGTTLKVNSTFDLTVTDVIANEGTLTIENNANLLQTNNVSNTGAGSTIVKRNSSALKRLDYTLWSSPVTGQGLYAFSKFTLPNRFYVYNTGTDLYSNSVGFSLTNLQFPAPLVNDELQIGVNGTDGNNVPFTTGKGYLIRVPYNHPTTPAVYNGVFTGVANNGDILPTISTALNGFNAVGNPYPSRLNVHNFIDGNTNITGPLYFWRKTNNSGISTSYATLTKTAYVANGATGGDTGAGFFNTGNETNWVINVGQGFIVKATSGSTINFTNSMRRSSNADQFFRNAQANTSVNNGLYWLNLTDNTGVYSQMAVGYSSEGTVGFDRGIDGENINEEFYLTSLIGADEYSIQGRPDFDSSDIVPLSYKATTIGSYTISIDHTAGAFTAATQAIYLKDNLTNTINNLNTAGYSFTSVAGTFNNRFEIVYQTQLVNPTFTANTVVIYNENNEFVVNSGNAIMASIKVFDIRGRLIEEKIAINANQTTIKGGLANQVLLVQITSEDGVVVTKKVIK
ncbi:T9SS sorting signal type C domain-containing protein [Flavobacterium sp.]|uniref:T9SS sorting signal type C domain-containing protein n=1 Tax=Flavobacterium sp. TaxID=239 RepID=UPI00248938CC|nr:T9SS sorting signal type C domain-containing protein [Flavobacterium sp.]MDI1315967.1 T9SS sorting signal type C domain-containing protein [Flavobacterium sp.]